VREDGTSVALPRRRTQVSTSRAWLAFKLGFDANRPGFDAAAAGEAVAAILDPATKGRPQPRISVFHFAASAVQSWSTASRARALAQSSWAARSRAWRAT
jgi:hypothetical protein